MDRGRRDFLNTCGKYALGGLAMLVGCSSNDLSLKLEKKGLYDKIQDLREYVKEYPSAHDEWQNADQTIMEYTHRLQSILTKYDKKRCDNLPLVFAAMMNERCEKLEDDLEEYKDSWPEIKEALQVPGFRHPLQRKHIKLLRKIDDNIDLLEDGLNK